MSAIHRGEWSERLEYENDRVVSRAWVNGKIWSYTYADRVRTVLVEYMFRGDVIDSFSLYHAEIYLMASLTSVFVFTVSTNLTHLLLLCLLLQGVSSNMKPKLTLKV